MKKAEYRGYSVDQETGKLQQKESEPIVHEPPKRYVEKTLSVVFSVFFISLSAYCLFMVAKLKDGATV